MKFWCFLMLSWRPSFGVQHLKGEEHPWKPLVFESQLYGLENRTSFTKLSSESLKGDGNFRLTIPQGFSWSFSDLGGPLSGLLNSNLCVNDGYGYRKRCKEKMSEKTCCNNQNPPSLLLPANLSGGGCLALIFKVVFEITFACGSLGNKCWWKNEFCSSDPLKSFKDNATYFSKNRYIDLKTPSVWILKTQNDFLSSTLFGESWGSDILFLSFSHSIVKLVE